MSQTEDRSYYEISLTNGQVLVAFSVLLACVLGAFVSGMWVAREALGDAPPGPAATRPAEPEEPRDSIDFFGRRSDASSPAAGGGEGTAAGEPSDAGSAAGARQAPAQPVTGEQVTAQQVRPQQVRPLPSERSVADPPSSGTADRQQTSRDATGGRGGSDQAAAPSEPETEPESPQLARSAAAADAPAAAVDSDRREPMPAGDGFVIQVFSSNDEGQAAALAQRLQSRGYPVFRANETVNGRTMYRVRVGPYPERSTAERQAEQLKREFKVETWVTASG